MTFDNALNEFDDEERALMAELRELDPAAADVLMKEHVVQINDAAPSYEIKPDDSDRQRGVGQAPPSIDDPPPRFSAELTYARGLTKGSKPEAARDFLESLADRVLASGTDADKYQYYTALGSAHLALQSAVDAGTLLMQAWQYGGDDDRVAANRALGHALLGQDDDAREWAQQALNQNPSNLQAHSVLLRVTARASNVGSAHHVPQALMEKAHVAYTLGFMALQADRYDEAEEWLEKARADTPDDSQIDGALGQAIFAQCVETQRLEGDRFVDAALQGRLERVVSLLTAAWDGLADMGLRTVNVQWLLTRSQAYRMLGDTSEARHVIEVALGISPVDPRLIQAKALLLRIDEDFAGASELLEQIQDDPDVPAAKLLRASVLRDDGDAGGAIRLLGELRDPDPSVVPDHDVVRLLAHCLLEEDRVGDAVRLHADLLEFHPDDVALLADAAAIAVLAGDSGKALDLLARARAVVGTGEGVPPARILAVADGLYDAEMYAEAAPLYERVADRSRDTANTRQLLNCYYETQAYDKAVEVCSGLRAAHGPLPYVTPMEAAIHDGAREYAAAREILAGYVQAWPDDVPAAIRLARLRCRAGGPADLREVDTFLDEILGRIGLGWREQIQVAQCLAFRERMPEAAGLLYELRRTHYDEQPEVHRAYIALFLSSSPLGDTWAEPAVVAQGAAVQVDVGGEPHWWIIDDREDVRPANRELRPGDPLAMRMMGAAVGAEVVIRERPLAPERGVVTAIQSKYVRAYQDSAERFEELFPDEEGIMRLHVDLGEDGVKDTIEVMRTLVARRQEHAETVRAMYDQGNLTVGAAAGLHGGHAIAAWADIVQHASAGPHVCVGSEAERKAALKLLGRDDVRLVADITALLTIRALGVDEAIVGAFGPLHTAQSTLDLVRLAHDELAVQVDQESFSVGLVEGQLAATHPTSDERHHAHQIAAELLDMTDRQCEVLPRSLGAVIPETTKHEHDELIGESFVDSALIAREHGGVLLSDDGRFRSLAQGEYGVDGLWTQAVLMECVDRRSMPKPQYDGAVVRLMELRYSHTAVDVDVLLRAAEDAGWGEEEPFHTVVQSVSGDRSDADSAVRIAASFLLKVWTYPMLEEQRLELTRKVLNTACQEREPGPILARVAEAVQQLFHLIPAHGKRVSVLIGELQDETG